MGKARGFYLLKIFIPVLVVILVSGLPACKGSGHEGLPAAGGGALDPETLEQRDARMAWWREARFGLFIHWGLYAVPAGQWKDETHHAEWILTTAQIPVDEYEKFAPQFNPVQFDVAAWVRAAKGAGMRYIVITSKHHDGFSLFDSQVTGYDVIDATPFGRDILKELEEECRKQGIRLCFYHSIMDWHHPDYLPRRGWESRPAEGADFGRYVTYMKGQVKELLTNYRATSGSSGSTESGSGPGPQRGAAISMILCARSTATSSSTTAWARAGREWPAPMIPPLPLAISEPPSRRSRPRA